MSFVIDLARFYLSNELVGNAEAALPSDYDIESSFVKACSKENSIGGVSMHSLDSSDVVLFPHLDEIRERYEYTNLVGWHIVPSVNLMEVFTRDNDGNVIGGISAKVFDLDNGFFFIPIAFPLDMRVISVLAYLSFEERIGLLTELVCIFSNLVRFHSGVESLQGDLVRCLGQLVGFLRLAVRDYRDAQADSSDDGSGNAGDDSPFHVASLSGGDS